MFDLSIIIPFFNEKENLNLLHQEIINTFEKSKLKVEIIYIDDGSNDRYLKSFKAGGFNKGKTSVKAKLIIFRRNFGQTAATCAGIDASRGKYITFLDADMQNDPNEIIKLIKIIKSGNYDGVIGWRKNRKDTFLRNFTSQMANFIIRRIFKVPFHDAGCSLKIVKREILNDLKFYGESHRIMPILLYWKGANLLEIPVKHRQRIAGKSKYNYTRVLKLVIDIITIKFLVAYQTKPAYVFGTTGIICNLLGFLNLVIVAFMKIMLGVYVHRNPFFIFAIFFILIGMQFILMGILAELLVRVYYESQNKKIYDIKSSKIF